MEKQSVKSVLIVEDDDSIRNTLKLALEFGGYQVQTASNGQEGLDLLREVPLPHLILLDLMMPVMNGWAFAEELQKSPALASIPIVIITAFEDKIRTFKGAVSVIKKPVDLDFLFETVDRFSKKEKFA